MIHFNWGELFLKASEAHLFSAAVGFLLLFILVFFGRKALKKGFFPAEKLSLQAGLEFFINFIYEMSESVIGPSGRKMVPVFASIFLVIWMQNILTLFPGFSAATDNLNATLALGVCTFVIYNYYGIKQHGWTYIRHFLGPVVGLIPFMLILELVTHIMRPVSLALRLYGNMMGDHTVLSSFVEMVPIGVPIIFYFVGLFVCTIQSFVFTMLSMIYYSMAISEEH